MSGLTDAEEDALTVAALSPDNDGSHNFRPLFREVERIIAAREAALAEQIAQAIEAAAVAADVDMIEVHGAFVRRAPYAAEHLRDAARIARETPRMSAPGERIGA